MTPRIQPFTQKMGINTDQVDLTKDKSPLDFFRFFLALDFVGRVMQSTNKNAQQVCAAKLQKHKSNWLPADTPFTGKVYRADLHHGRPQEGLDQGLLDKYP